MIFKQLAVELRSRMSDASINLYCDDAKEAHDLIHQLLNYHKIDRTLLISEDGDFFLNSNLQFMLSTRFGRISTNTEMFIKYNRFIFILGYFFSGCDNYRGIKFLVSQLVFKQNSKTFSRLFDSLL